MLLVCNNKCTWVAAASQQWASTVCHQGLINARVILAMDSGPALSKVINGYVLFN